MKFVKLCLFVFLGLILFTSCGSDNSQPQFESFAVISGFDMALCPCCGGWIILIDGQESDNRFSDLPQNSTIDLVD